MSKIAFGVDKIESRFTRNDRISTSKRKVRGRTGVLEPHSFVILDVGISLPLLHG